MSLFPRRRSDSQVDEAKRHRWWWLVPAAAVVVAGIAFAGWVGLNLRPPASDEGNVLVMVQPGESVAEVADQLQNKGLIRSATLFRWYVSYVHKGQEVKAGAYRLTYGQTLPQLVTALTEGTEAATIRVTIPEGFTVTQIADRLAVAGVVKRKAFLQEVQSGHFQEPFLAEIGHRPQVRWRLEGYLFPDTYEFTKGESAHAVVGDMLEDFQRRVASVYGTTMHRQGQSLSQVVTEASLIEKEAKVDAERPLIASVINNRLHHRPPMKLQIDATIEYILGHRDVVTVEDTHVDNPYNTYLHSGLPPGPIASPGLASIRAVLHPAHTDYLYYVAKNDGSGEHYFAATYAQQLRNEARSQHNLHAQS
ncbi:endolytic transglycosylase MltG [Alicyclobacillus shizuokensis]|uniref:endolytic transglycosylase MltG n=1 Tax=Alicyclobacillus shizuokensis TaxID=392014 RepID=UPI00082E2834|nr:endolytic transglycosylase MltG [Alicyclobacillus shizuokensis]